MDLLGQFGLRVSLHPGDPFSSGDCAENPDPKEQQTIGVNIYDTHRSNTIL